MAEQTRSEKRQRRSDAREKRRSLAAKPFEALDQAAGAEAREGPGRETLKQAAATAALGAVVAGVAGAAKALADRRDDQPAPKADRQQDEQAPEAEPQTELQDVGPESDEQDDEQAHGDDAQLQEPDEPDAESEPEDNADQDEPPQSAGETEMHAGEGQGEEETPEGSTDEPQAPDERADSGPAPRGASPDEVKEIVDEAKRELQELVGVEPERVSGFDRSDGRWTVTLEVVGVRRIPDTTDVLSSYEITFDDDRNLVSVNETRRYRRSQVEEG